MSSISPVSPDSDSGEDGFVTRKEVKKIVEEVLKSKAETRWCPTSALKSYFYIESDPYAGLSALNGQVVNEEKKKRTP